VFSAQVALSSWRSHSCRASAVPARRPLTELGLHRGLARHGFPVSATGVSDDTPLLCRLTKLSRLANPLTDAASGAERCLARSPSDGLLSLRSGVSAQRPRVADGGTSAQSQRHPDANEH
jgi:hypothetical protein